MKCNEVRNCLFVIFPISYFTPKPVENDGDVQNLIVKDVLRSDKFDHESQFYLRLVKKHICKTRRLDLYGSSTFDEYFSYRRLNSEPMKKDGVDETLCLRLTPGFNNRSKL